MLQERYSENNKRGICNEGLVSSKRTLKNTWEISVPNTGIMIFDLLENFTKEAICKLFFPEIAIYVVLFRVISGAALYQRGCQATKTKESAKITPHWGLNLDWHNNTIRFKIKWNIYTSNVGLTCKRLVQKYIQIISIALHDVRTGHYCLLAKCIMNLWQVRTRFYQSKRGFPESCVNRISILNEKDCVIEFSKYKQSNRTNPI